MLISEMQQAFKVGFDKTDSLNYPGFEPEEIDLWLNTAQDRLVKTRYGGNNVYRKGFEETQKRTDDLRTIIHQVTLLPQPQTVLNKPNGTFFILSNNPAGNDVYWFSVQEDAVVTIADCNGNLIKKSIPVKPITHDQYNRIILDPFNKPYEKELVRLFAEGNIEVICPLTSTLTSLISLNVRYVRKPQRVSLANSVSCELPDHMHIEVVDSAVSMALENIESGRYRTNVNELSKEE